MVGGLGDGGKLDVAEHFNGRHAFELGQIKGNGLGEPGQVGDAKNGLVGVFANISEHFTVFRLKKPQGAPAKNLEQLAQGDHVAHPAQKAGWVGLLGFHVDRFVAPHRVHDDG